MRMEKRSRGKGAGLGKPEGRPPWGGPRFGASESPDGWADPGFGAFGEDQEARPVLPEGESPEVRRQRFRERRAAERPAAPTGHEVVEGPAVHMSAAVPILWLLAPLVLVVLWAFFDR